MDARGPGSDHEELTASRSQRALLFSPRGGGDQLRDQVKENLGHLSRLSDGNGDGRFGMESGVPFVQEETRSNKLSRPVLISLQLACGYTPRVFAEAAR